MPFALAAETSLRGGAAKLSWFKALMDKANDEVGLVGMLSARCGDYLSPLMDIDWGSSSCLIYHYGSAVQHIRKG
jgi:hypothetical protein